VPRRRALFSGILALALAGSPARAATFTVTNTNDSGFGSLRQALLDANGSPGFDDIRFNIPGSDVHTISPLLPLPPVTDLVSIDGFSQPGYSGTPVIEISGAQAGTGVDGLRFWAGSDSSGVGGLAISRFRSDFLGRGGNGIVLQSVSGVEIAGNVIGASPSGWPLQGNASAGVWITGAVGNSVRGNRIAGNSVGILISGMGSSANNVWGNRVWANLGNGIVVESGTGNFIGGGPTVEGAPTPYNLITENLGNGVLVSGGAVSTRIFANRIGTDGLQPLPNGGDGIEVNGASGTQIDWNLVSGNAGNGILLVNGAAASLVRSNLVGVSASGIAPIGNMLDGILVSGANNNTIGSQGGISGNPWDRNVVAGNGANGIRLRSGASGNRVYGNWVGIDSTGSPLANQKDGVQLNDGATSNDVGGTFPFMPNFIGGNAGNGVRIADATTTGNHLFGNSIGVGEAGTIAGNGGHGVSIEAGASGNAIGGVGVGEPNLIAHNLGSGVFVESGTGNEIVSRIFGNGGLGIDLAPAGVTDNDAGDADSGPNGLQNFPVLVSQVPASGPRTVAGTLQSAPGSPFRIDLYSSSDCDPSGNGEGEFFLGSAQVMTDGNGDAAFEINADVFLPASLTATATDAAGNTSEFSACLPVATNLNTIAPCRLADTRQVLGPYGGPSLSAGVPRAFAVNPLCGIPASAMALAVNVTVAGPSSGGHLTVYPGPAVPPTSTLNYRAGQTRANNVIVPLAPGRVFQVRCVQPSGTADVIVDVTGYFE